MSERLKIGLVGAGVFAGYHANKLSEHPRVEFIGVFDRNDMRAAALSEKHRVPVLTASRLFAVSDAVVIASSASAHGSMATHALSEGCHCLIEKPLATSTTKAEEIIALAAQTNRIVQVGHQERMVLQAIGLRETKERPITIEAVRNSPYSVRGTDTSVTFDLMTHDIDLCTALMGGAPDEVTGQSASVRSETADMAYGVLRYGSSTARLSASRVETQSQRWMTLTYPSGEVRIDFNTKTLTNTTPFALNENFGDDENAKDSLGAATDVFVRAVLDGSLVLVDAQEGAIAVAAAETIDRGA